MEFLLLIEVLKNASFCVCKTVGDVKEMKRVTDSQLIKTGLETVIQRQHLNFQVSVEFVL